ncbi:hypothetical protein D3C80_1097700 [compost metagenome]
MRLILVGKIQRFGEFENRIRTLVAANPVRQFVFYFFVAAQHFGEVFYLGIMQFYVVTLKRFKHCTYRAFLFENLFDIRDNQTVIVGNIASSNFIALCFFRVVFVVIAHTVIVQSLDAFIIPGRNLGIQLMQKHV